VKKPAGPCGKWSDTQISRWIKYLIGKGRFAFDEAGHALGQGEERLFSSEEMVECIKRGLLTRREQKLHKTPTKDVLQERAVFSKEFDSRPRDIGNVVAAISDDEDDCVIITAFWKKKR
jgi:hypothetical protein